MNKLNLFVSVHIFVEVSQSPQIISPLLTGITVVSVFVKLLGSGCLILIMQRFPFSTQLAPSISIALLDL
jgi:hypothetical protein